jgi:IclR family acetate operon transcriptional repressor
LDGQVSDAQRTPAHKQKSAIGKAVAVIEAMTRNHRLSEIARATGLPTSTVHRILQDLVELGWCRESADRTYTPGARLLTVVGQATDSLGVLQAARPSLRELCERTGHTVHLALREGDEAVYVDKLDGRRIYRMRSRIGLSIPLHSTAIGKALLARLPDDEVRMIAARTGLPARTERTITDVSTLLSHLTLVRRHGFAVDNEENEVHVRCVGAAIIDHRGIPIGGLSISSLAFELDAEHIRTFAPLVIRAAREVSAALGASV